MDHAIVVASSDGSITHWNEGATAFFGYAATEAIGRAVDFIVPEDLRAKHWEGFRRVMDGGERHLVGACINLPVRVQSGEVLAFPARFVHLDDPHGRAVGAVAVFSRRAGNERPWTPIDS
jgi:PAS domain S-box-containing protein